MLQIRISFFLRPTKPLDIQNPLYTEADIQNQMGGHCSERKYHLHNQAC